MRLPRRTSAQSQQGITQELQSQRAGAITPAERARETTAKYGAIAAGAKAIGDVMVGLSEIQAEEQLTDSTASYNAGVAQIDEDMAAMPGERNALGEPVFDVEKRVEAERKAREAMTSTIRESITNGTARREFDKMITTHKVEMDAKYRAKMTEEGLLFLGEAAQSKVDGFVQDNQFDAAHEKNRAALDSGSLGIKQYNDNRVMIDKATDIDHFYGIINAVKFDPSAAEDAVAELADGKVGTRSIALNDEQVSIVQGKLLSRYNAWEAGNETDLKDAKWQNYLTLKDLQLDRELTEDMVMSAARNNAITPADTERLLSDLEPETKGNFSSIGSTQQVYDGYSREVDMLLAGPEYIATAAPPLAPVMNLEYEWDEKFEQLRKQIRMSDMSDDNQEKLINKMKKVKKELTTDEEYKLLKDYAGLVVSGYKEDQITVMTESMRSQFSDTLLITNEFKQVVAEERLRLGPGKSDELKSFIEQQAPIYKLKVNNKLLKDVGVKFKYPESGEIDEEYMRSMGGDIVKWFDARPQAGGVRDAKKIARAIDELERLNGIDLWSYLTADLQGKVTTASAMRTGVSQ